MTYDYLTYNTATIPDDDPVLIGKCAGLINEGMVHVVARSAMTIEQANTGISRASLMLAELEQAKEHLQVEQQIVEENASEIARRLERDMGKAATAQEIVDAQLEKQRQKRRRKQRAPATVSKDDPRAIGLHASSIAQGHTRVV